MCSLIYEVLIQVSVTHCDSDHRNCEEDRNGYTQVYSLSDVSTINSLPGGSEVRVNGKRGLVIFALEGDGVVVADQPLVGERTFFALPAFT